MSATIAFTRTRPELAVHYRGRAGQLRAMAEDEANDQLREDLIRLAEDYEGLAKTISAGAFSVVRKPQAETFSRPGRFVERFRVWRSS